MPEGVAEKISSLMNAADLVSVGSRPQVLEDGNGVCNSERDSYNEDHGEKLEGAYMGIPTNSHGDPESSAHKMTTEQVNMARSAYHQAPPPLPSDPEHQHKTSKGTSKKKSQEVPLDPVQQEKNGEGTTKKKSQEGDSTHGMTTRSKSKNASRAGSSRPWVGSVSTDTCITSGHPS
jgi:hypothetical protein